MLCDPRFRPGKTCIRNMEHDSGPGRRNYTPVQRLHFFIHLVSGLERRRIRKGTPRFPLLSFRHLLHYNTMPLIVTYLFTVQEKLIRHLCGAVIYVAHLFYYHFTSLLH